MFDEETIAKIGKDLMIAKNKYRVEEAEKTENEFPGVNLFSTAD